MQQGSLDKKGKYLEIAMLANKKILEVENMSTATKEIIYEMAKKQGWLEQERVDIAKNFLRGRDRLKKL